MVALRSQGNWRWEGPLGTPLGLVFGRGPHLQLRQEPQGTSDFRLRSQGPCRLGTFHFHALEKEMATHSSVLAWRIPGTGEPGGLPSMGSHRVRHD